MREGAREREAGGGISFYLERNSLGMKGSGESITDAFLCCGSYGSQLFGEIVGVDDLI